MLTILLKIFFIAYSFNFSIPLQGDFLAETSSDIFSNNSSKTFVKKDLSGLPDFSADKLVVLSDRNSPLFSKSADEVQPIASITKLMSALVFLDEAQDLNKIYKITEEDMVEGGKRNLFLGDEISFRNLLYTALIASDNGAALALGHALNLSSSEFVLKMNEKAKELSLFNTSFADPIGLDEKNISTAREVALLLKIAWEKEEIARALSLPEYRFETIQGREKYIVSTDAPLLLEDNIFSESNEYPIDFKKLKALGGKTGYIPESGYCFVGRFLSPEGEIFTVAALNSANKNSRFSDTLRLSEWVYNTYEIFR